MSDSLFDVDRGAYSTGFRLPDEQSGAERRGVGTSRTLRTADKGEMTRFERAVLAQPLEVEFTAETIRAELGDTILAPNQFGALLQSMAKRRLIRKTGYTTATRPEAHARVIATWRRCS